MMIKRGSVLTIERSNVALPLTDGGALIASFGEKILVLQDFDLARKYEHCYVFLGIFRGEIFQLQLYNAEFRVMSNVV